MKHAETQVVLFLDLLGFASLTEQHPLNVDLISKSERPLSWTIEDILAYGDNALTKAFSSFHSSLKHAIDLAKMKHSLTAITFSDSAFVATDQLFQAANVAVSVVKSLLRQGIPVRAGIACGSFAAVRFRSDVSSDGGDHAAHFLGTGVARSYATENCGIKGIRILIHPSAHPLLRDSEHSSKNRADESVRFVECSEAERANQEHVRHEIDYWRFGITDEKKTWRAFQDMWNASPDAENVHYQATAEAINRMRIQQGQAELTNLRRRTLPKRVPHESVR